ncbi:hypothetical protein JCM10207_008283 [Rhodosporidiobolus poonsookiae]
MAQPDRPQLARQGTTQLSSLSRSSRLDSLASIANSAQSPPRDTAEGSGMASGSRSPSPQHPTDPAEGAGGVPNSSSLSPRPPFSTSSSHSSTRTNAGFVVTSRPRTYAPPSPSPGPAASDAPAVSNPFFARSTPSSSSASTSTATPYPPPAFSHSGHLSAGLPPALGTRRGSSPAALPHASHSRSQSTSVDVSGCQSPASGAYGEPKTTLHLSSSIDNRGRRMINQYVRLQTIGHGSHGKVWLCAEPTIQEEDEELDGVEEEVAEEAAAAPAAHSPGAESPGKRKRRRTPSERWEENLETGRVQYYAVKLVQREGVQKGKSLRAAGRKKGSSQGSGIGTDDQVKKEVAIMKRLDHPNVVRLKEVIDDAKSKKVFMVLEFMAGGQVPWQDENKRPVMTVKQARDTFRQVVLGLEYLHYQGIIHRDIKPANLLWTEDHKTVKISDFGVSHVSKALSRCSAEDPAACLAHDDQKALQKTAGSPAFFAPELCLPHEHTPSVAQGPSPAHHHDTSVDPSGDDAAYFPFGVEATHLAPPNTLGSAGALYSPPATPSIPLTNKLISLPWPPGERPRTRPPIGREIDVWALGITLYCLLFGDTPYTAPTEWALYNVILDSPIAIPERMGREGQWTGFGEGWSGCGDGAEGREVVDLLGRLLEKDKDKRITLEEVKKHPWVLRDLSSPDKWLSSTDPTRDVKFEDNLTAEELKIATQERDPQAAPAPLRSRLGVRRALDIAFARFPSAFSRNRSTRTTSTTSEAPTAEGGRDRRSRSKSNSSNSQGCGETPIVSRQPSDSSRVTRPGKLSHEFGVDLRRIISGASSGPNGEPRSPSPAHGNRGGWGNRSASRKTTADSLVSPTSPNSASSHGFPELARSVSTSSVLGNSGGRSHFTQHLFGRKHSDFDTSRSNASSNSFPSGTRSSFVPSPFSAGSDTEGQPNSAKGSHRTLSRMLSRLGGGGGSGSGREWLSRSKGDDSGSATPSRKHSSSSTEEGSEEVASVSALGIAPGVVEQFEGEQFDSFGRAIGKGKAGGAAADSQSVASGLTRAKGELDAATEGELEDGQVGYTDLDYTDSDIDSDIDDDDEGDELDDFMHPPLASANHLSGWKSPDFGDFRFGVRSPSEDDAAGAAYLSSAAGTPPTDELDPLEDGEMPKRKPSPPRAVPLPDNVSYAFVPLDYEFAPPASPVRYHSLLANGADTPQAQPNGTLLSPSSAEQFRPPSRAPSPSGTFSPARTETSSPVTPRSRGVSPDPHAALRSKNLAGAAALSRAWQQAEEDDDGEEEMLVVPRRRRAATLSGMNSPTAAN